MREVVAAIDRLSELDRKESQALIEFQVERRDRCVLAILNTQTRQASQVEKVPTHIRLSLGLAA